MACYSKDYLTGWAVLTYARALYLEKAANEWRAYASTQGSLPKYTFVYWRGQGLRPGTAQTAKRTRFIKQEREDHQR